MPFFKKQDSEENEQFLLRVRIIGREAFLIIAATLGLVFLVFQFGTVKSAVLSVESYIRGILFGVVFAFLMDPVCQVVRRYLEKVLANRKHGKSIAKGIAIIVSVLVGLGAVAILVGMILPSLIESIGTLVNNLPTYAGIVQKWINERIQDDTELAGYLNTFIGSASGTLSTWIQGKLTDLSAEIITQITSSIIDFVKFIVNFFVGVVVSIYLLRDKESAIGQMKKLTYAILPRRHADLVLETAREGNRIFGGFVHGKILDSLIVGVICLIFTMLTKMPYAVLVSAIVCVTNVIPFFGPFLGAVPSAFLILLVSPIKCLEFLGFIIVLQQVDGNIIGPKILGNQVGINEFWVTFSLLLFGGIFGFFGMLIGVPLFAVCYYIIVRLMNHELRKKALPQGSENYREIHSYRDIQGTEAALHTLESVSEPPSVEEGESLITSLEAAFMDSLEKDSAAVKEGNAASSKASSKETTE